ncbi:MAG: Hsp70 family protein [Armatimonadetes bacterium]|nr:Hsp70 family protein [Armatimonadota bacterium]
MSNTVDFGIDLGTTSSALARMMRKGPEIVPTRSGQKTLPSAVRITDGGNLLVGDEATDKWPCRSQFKRDMGATVRYEMGSREMSPVELSAEVLKELKYSASRRYEVDMDQAVITVPAMFSQPQCQATHEAAALASIDAVTLLQEPIAAATAYLSDDPEDGQYLVFDLGGGTFDVSIILMKQKEMHVVHHGGDNYLGGSDFDKKVQQWICSEIGTELSSIPEPERWGMSKSVERAKIKLSDLETTDVDLSDVKGVHAPRFTLTRERLNELVRDDIDRTIRIAREQLAECKLDASDMRSVLLVGGPTQMPIVRNRLRQELGIPLNLDQDPMTVVACGAAIHASALPRRSSERTTTSAGVDLELHYECVTNERTAHVSGRIANRDSFAGEVRIQRSNGDWDTGWIALRNGAFVTELELSKDIVTEFSVEVRDSSGATITSSPNTFAIRSGIAAAAPVAPYNYGVALEDGSCKWIVKAGASLPVRERVELPAAASVERGSDETVFVHFLEGKSEHADDNVRRGHVVICGRDISRPIRPGDKVTVTIRMDESRLIRAVVELEKEEREWEARFHSLTDEPPIEDLREMIRRTQDDLERIDLVVSEDDQGGVNGLLRELEVLEADVENLRYGEPGQSERVLTKISDLRSRVRKFSQKYMPAAKREEAEGVLDEAEVLAANAGDQIDLATVRELKGDLEKAEVLGDKKLTESILERGRNIWAKHYMNTPECWRGQIDWLRPRYLLVSNPSQFHEYVRRAEACLNDRDLQGARINCIEARELLPASEKHIERFGGSLI